MYHFLKATLELCQKVSVTALIFAMAVMFNKELWLKLSRVATPLLLKPGKSHWSFTIFRWYRYNFSHLTLAIYIQYIKNANLTDSMRVSSEVSSELFVMCIEVSSLMLSDFMVVSLSNNSDFFLLESCLEINKNL